MSSAASLKPQRVPLTVTVTGSAATSTVDDNGHFTLTNVPAGNVDLHFMGSGVDAHLRVNVAERATLVITVRINGNDARLEDDHGNNDRDAAEVKGQIVSGSLSGSCAAHTLAFTVGSTRVITNASTLFRDGSCDSLKAGTQVEVKGTRQSDASVVASRVERKR